MSERLAGEVALVTGSTSGIGRQIAIQFAEEGAKVAVTGRNVARGAEVVDQIVAAGGEAVFLAADLLDSETPRRIVAEATDRLGPLTVLVNNAAGGDAGKDAPVGEIEAASWEAKLRVNLTAPAMLCQAAIPHMLAAGHGSIINISTRAAERASANLSAYISSKGGLNALTRSIAVDYAKQGIRCNTISPGYVVNPKRDADITPERRARYEAMHLNRLGTAQDVAYCAVYLASHESGWLTGVLIPLDGGGSAARGAVLG